MRKRTGILAAGAACSLLLLSSCSLSTDGESSALASQAARPETSSVEQASQPTDSTVSSLLALTPEKEDGYRMLGRLLAEASAARESGEGTLYLEGDHIKIYQEEIDYLAASGQATAREWDMDPEEWAVRQMKIQAAFCWAAEQEGLEIDKALLDRSLETASQQFVNPEDELFYPGNMLMIEGSGLSQQEFLACYMDWGRRDYIAGEYADSKFSQWQATWEQTEATQVESWTDGINSTVNAAWAEEQLRMAEEILAADHAELK